MEKRIYDKKTGIHYELQGDYYLPCLELSEQPKVEIGIWGKRHMGKTAFALHQAAPQNPLYQSADKL